MVGAAMSRSFANKAEHSNLSCKKEKPRVATSSLASFNPITVALSIALAVGCYDAMAPADAPRRPIPERIRADGLGGPPPSFGESLSINPDSYIVLPTFSYTTWVEFSVTGGVTLHSLAGSRTTYEGPVYPRGVWAQLNNCALRVSIVYAATSIDAKQTCEQGPVSFVDTIPVKGSGTARRGSMPYEDTNACLPSPTCHSVSGSAQYVTVNALPVTLNKLIATPRLVNFAAVSYAYVDFNASRNPSQFTTDGNATATPITITGWIYDAVDGVDEQVWASCPPGFSTLLCHVPLHRAGRMKVKAFTGGWEQTSTITIQCPVAGDSILNDSKGDFAIRSALQNALDSSNADSAVDAGFAPGSKRGYRIETGGVIYRMPDSSYIAVFVRDPAATQCHYAPDLSQVTPPPGAVGVAIFHTHPDYEGDVSYGCRRDPKTHVEYQQYPGGPGAQALSDPEGNGGGSGTDWDTANHGYPVYVISKRTRVSRLDPGHPGGDTTNVNRWFAKGLPAKCQWVK